MRTEEVRYYGTARAVRAVKKAIKNGWEYTLIKNANGRNGCCSRNDAIVKEPHKILWSTSHCDIITMGWINIGDHSYQCSIQHPSYVDIIQGTKPHPKTFRYYAHDDASDEDYHGEEMSLSKAKQAAEKRLRECISNGTATAYNARPAGHYWRV